jgi:uncharacterized protein
MASDFDPYRILGIEPSAGQADIDQAYRRQWAEHGHSLSPEARLRELQTAYRILSDPSERRAYDERRATMPTAPTAVADRPRDETPAPVRRDEPAWTVGDIGRAIAVVIAVVVITTIPVYLIAGAIAGSADEIDKDPYALSVVLIVSFMFQVAAVGSAWYFGVRKYKLSIASLGLRTPEKGWPWLPFGLVGGAMGIVIIYGIILAIAGIEPDTDLPDAVYDNTLPLTIALILTVVVAPFAEEVFFRGFVFGGLARRWGWVWGALGGGILFGAAHLANAGYFYVVPPIVAIGFMFAWARKYSHSIYPSMAAHFMFNLLQMIAVLASR